MASASNVKRANERSKFRYRPEIGHFFFSIGTMCILGLVFKKRTVGKSHFLTRHIIENELFLHSHHHLKSICYSLSVTNNFLSMLQNILWIMSKAIVTHKSLCLDISLDKIRTVFENYYKMVMSEISFINHILWFIFHNKLMKFIWLDYLKSIILKLS